MEGMEGMETKERGRVRDCRDTEAEGRESYRALISEGQSLLLCCLSACVSSFVSFSKRIMEKKMFILTAKNFSIVFVFI